MHFNFGGRNLHLQIQTVTAPQTKGKQNMRTPQKFLYLSGNVSPLPSYFLFSVYKENRYCSCML